MHYEEEPDCRLFLSYIPHRRSLLTKANPPSPAPLTHRYLPRSAQETRTASTLSPPTPRKEERQRCSRAATTDKLRCQTNARKHPTARHSFPSHHHHKRCGEHPNSPTLTTLCTSTSHTQGQPCKAIGNAVHPKHPNHTSHIFVQVTKKTVKDHVVSTSSE